MEAPTQQRSIAINARCGWLHCQSDHLRTAFSASVGAIGETGGSITLVTSRVVLSHSASPCSANWPTRCVVPPCGQTAGPAGSSRRLRRCERARWIALDGLHARSVRAALLSSRSARERERERERTRTLCSGAGKLLAMAMAIASLLLSTTKSDQIRPRTTL